MCVNFFQILDDFCNPIINKPKPQVEPPPKPQEDAKKADLSKTETEKGKQEKTEEMETDEKNNQPSSNGPNLDMEVD